MGSRAGKAGRRLFGKGQSGGSTPSPPLTQEQLDLRNWQQDLDEQIKKSKEQRDIRQQLKDKAGIEDSRRRSDAQAKQRLWDDAKNWGHPLNTNQNAAYNRIMFLHSTGQPVDTSEFHKATFKSLVKYGYVDKQGHPTINTKTGRPSIPAPLTKKQWQHIQERSYQDIYKVPHPRAAKREHDKFLNRPSQVDLKKVGFTINKLMNDLKKMKK